MPSDQPRIVYGRIAKRETFSGLKHAIDVDTNRTLCGRTVAYTGRQEVSQQHPGVMLCCRCADVVAGV